MLGKRNKEEEEIIEAVLKEGKMTMEALESWVGSRIGTKPPTIEEMEMAEQMMSLFGLMTVLKMKRNK